MSDPQLIEVTAVPVGLDSQELLGETWLDDEGGNVYRWRIRVRALNLVVAISGEMRGWRSHDDAETAGRRVRNDVEWTRTSASGHPLVDPVTIVEDVTGADLDADDALDDPEN